MKVNVERDVNIEAVLKYLENKAKCNIAIKYEQCVPIDRQVLIDAHDLIVALTRKECFGEYGRADCNECPLCVFSEKEVSSKGEEECDDVL